MFIHLSICDLLKAAHSFFFFSIYFTYNSYFQFYDRENKDNFEMYLLVLYIMIQINK